MTGGLLSSIYGSLSKLRLSINSKKTITSDNNKTMTRAITNTTDMANKCVFLVAKVT